MPPGKPMYLDPFDEFVRMRQEMERMMNEMVRQSIMDAKNLEKMAADPKTCVYGFSIRVGPDGKPVVREFGNIKPNSVNPANPAQSSLASDEREPLVDVIPTENEVVVIAEIPGVEKHEIKLNSTTESLTISVNNPQRRYHRVVSLPCEVDPTGVVASYKNGVLEVTHKRVLKSDGNGHEIHVK
ncbi:heat-shock protein Hsp20 [Candidatus Micrarchaeota archaeon CG08_land_8_20_14_0_20_49_17]|nr:MAG: hypothetical protein AUJ13_02170 [Candidatus Micrarchaeota archaeon CG1_02_49_24]PIU09941.1 MAG: heat-shock protein Hsp20 [Candidatus Micrarchaeota archaeon CG08_land_8_20_14_0_20_49_17]HII53458.1 Hsp20/alpha crystallin family protein [Candidatus Micrarchaeota archaeon]